MRVACQVVWLPKRGNSLEEYEDAASPFQNTESDADVFRCAVADGATETSFSGLWAKLLCDGFVSGEQMNALRAKWLHQISGKELPWYAEQKAESGAFAAIIGLVLNSDGSKKSKGTWTAEAVGDCCVVHTRERKLLTQFPLTSSEQFNSSPFLLCSQVHSEDQEPERITTSGEWKKGDVFYLMSDAIARWSYKRQEEHGDITNWLDGLITQEAIEKFSELERDHVDDYGRAYMRNDDVTLMRVSIA